MLLAESCESLSAQICSWKDAGLSISFVPTMGNLHEGHLSLVQQAKQLADKTVVSVYVNPMQFGENEDFDAYPRTFDSDRNALQQVGADLLFLPSSTDMYPQGPKKSTNVSVPGISNILCGEYRPGHFEGVATIVCKFFNLVQADFALFGEKDFQQVAVIRKMVKDLFMPVEIHSLPTVREADGLAMSSRNQYLKQEERELAVNLYRVLQYMARQAKQGAVLHELESQGREKLTALGFEPEYLSFRNAHSLAPAQSHDHKLVLVVAAWLGKTRLIDNVSLQILRK